MSTSSENTETCTKGYDVRRDFRSDTVTQPTDAMRRAMLEACVGDDDYDDDPTVHALQRKVASLTAKESALFCVSATLANIIAVAAHLHLRHGKRGDVIAPEILCDVRSHLYAREYGQASVLNRAHVHGITPSASGFAAYVTADDFSRRLHLEDDLHQPLTTLLSVEVPTPPGLLYPHSELLAIRSLSRQHGIPVHMDGSRLWNAAIASGHSLEEYAATCDTVTLCLSKGLGAPIGAVLCGSDDFIAIARLFRKAFGGGWRQAGVMAAPALCAIETQWDRLSEDHENARYLARKMAAIGFVAMQEPDINIVTFPLPSELAQRSLDWRDIAQHAKRSGITLKVKPTVCRMYTHKHITTEAIDELCACLSALWKDTIA